MSPLPAQPRNAVETEGRVSAVTVYQGQALVTREVEVPEAQGLLEVVVTNLPENVLPGSLFAEPTDGVQIRSVRLSCAADRERCPQGSPRTRSSKFKPCRINWPRSPKSANVLKQRKSYLTQLETVLGRHVAAGTQERRAQRRDAQRLSRSSCFTERDSISKRELELAVEERARNQERELLARQRDTIAAGSARTVREAVVFINAPQRGAAKLRLSYLVSNASWTPVVQRAGDRRRATK